MDLQGTESRPLLARGPSLGVRALLLALLSLLLMVLDQQQGHLQSLRSGLSVLTYPVRFMVDLPFALGRWVDSSLASRSSLLNSNEQLRLRLLEQQVQLQRLASLESENARLRAMMQSSSRVADRVKVAEILSVALDPFQHRLVIDRGGRDGAYTGQALIDADGVMGQVTRAEPMSSEAILISDPSAAIPVEFNRNGLRTIAVGTGDVNRLSLPFLPNNADVQPNDLLITSGLGGTYPPGYPVGVISKIDIKPGEQFAEIEATPAAALNRSRVVLLVWPGTQLEQTAGDDTETTAEATAGDEAETTTAEQAEEPGQ